MKHFNRHHLALMPLLSILALSPTIVEAKLSGRQITSMSEITESKHPRLEELVKKVNQDLLLKDFNINLEKFKEKKEAFRANLTKEREEFKKDQSDKELVAEQRKKVESFIIDLVLIEAGQKTLKQQEKLDSTEDEGTSKLLSDAKDIVETLLTDLEASEQLIVQDSQLKDEEPKIEVEEDKPMVTADQPQVEESVQDESKAEEQTVVVGDQPKEEAKKEESKGDICEAEKENKVLTAKVEELMKQQSQILQTMLGMAQIMVQMNQQSQSGGIYQQYQMPLPNPYMYQQPMTAGNWVYYPGGFQPNQTNIFSAQGPQMQMQTQMPPQMGPGALQSQGNWQLRPSYQFADPRFNTRPMSYGQFGNEPFVYNFSDSPTVTQL